MREALRSAALAVLLPTQCARSNGLRWGRGVPGHETTGHTMSALLSLLLRNPHVLERLRQEQAAIVAQHGPGLSGAAPHLARSFGHQRERRARLRLRGCL